MPTLLSSYHAGRGRESIDFQSGVYCCSEDGKWHKHRTAIKIDPLKEYIFSIYKSKTKYNLHAGQIIMLRKEREKITNLRLGLMFLVP